MLGWPSLPFQWGTVWDEAVSKARYSCLGFACLFYTLSSATGISPCILLVVPEKPTAVKYQHILEKYFLTHHSKSRQPHLSTRLIVWYILCPLPTRVHLLFAALKTALVQTFWCTCWCLYIKVERGKTDHPPVSAAKSSISVLNHGSEDEEREPGMDCWAQEGLAAPHGWQQLDWCWDGYLSAIWDSRGRSWYLHSTCCGTGMHLYRYLQMANSFGSLAKLFPKWFK